MRVDNSDSEVIAYYKLIFNPDDPGETEPVDLCLYCSMEWSGSLLIDHPDYTENDYLCFECDTKLTRMDEYNQ